MRPPYTLRRIAPFLFLLLSGDAAGQRIEIRDADPLTMPGRVDSNSPAFHLDGKFHLLNSTGGEPPLLSSGSDQSALTAGERVRFPIASGHPTWIEAVWVDPSGVVIAWYHQEHEWICGPARPSLPQIGVAYSYDHGRSFEDAGLILTSGDPPDCSSQNGYFNGGHGDFSVVLDREEKYFYILFGNYGGALQTQGVVTARLAYEDRFQQAGNVWKYYQGDWSQPGRGGITTPLFPASASWQQADTDSFWGPSVHWNTHLKAYVALLNRSCCVAGFPQEGIYVTFNTDIGNPAGWSPPKKLLENSGWYPQVLGLGEGETDSIAGRKARLYIQGVSWWELVFGEPEDGAEPGAASVSPN